jgi:tRNA threonylcarbamoyladenosine biosynthesis protein TsaE
VKLTSRSPDDTVAIGLRLGKLLKAGDVVGLYGDLGAGKTTMVKGIAGAFGIDARDVTSASFTIIAEYESSPPFCHIDLYRISGSEDIDNTGFWECTGGRSVSVVEWAEKLGDSFAEDIIRVTIADKGDMEREISIEGIDEKDWNNL